MTLETNILKTRKNSQKALKSLENCSRNYKKIPEAWKKFWNLQKVREFQKKKKKKNLKAVKNFKILQKNSGSSDKISTAPRGSQRLEKFFYQQNFFKLTTNFQELKKYSVTQEKFRQKNFKVRKKYF